MLWSSVQESAERVPLILSKVLALFAGLKMPPSSVMLRKDAVEQVLLARPTVSKAPAVCAASRWETVMRKSSVPELGSSAQVTSSIQILMFAARLLARVTWRNCATATDKVTTAQTTSSCRRLCCAAQPSVAGTSMSSAQGRTTRVHRTCGRQGRRRKPFPRLNLNHLLPQIQLPPRNRQLRPVQRRSRRQQREQHRILLQELRLRLAQYRVQSRQRSQYPRHHHVPGATQHRLR
jgi:hypothetical protein